MQPAGLPGRTTGRGAATTPYPSTRRGTSLSPQHLDYRHAGTRPHEHGHLHAERESHEASQPCPANSSADAKLQAETLLDTGPLLRDEWTRAVVFIVCAEHGVHDGRAAADLTCDTVGGPERVQHADPRVCRKW